MALLLFVGATGGQGLPAARGALPPECASCRFNFGNVVKGAVIEHPFVLRNDGNQPLRITGVQLSPPMQLARMPAVIPPKGNATLKLSLDTSNLEGAYAGDLVVMVVDSDAPARKFSMVGRIRPAIEVLPRPAFFLSTLKGVAKSGTLEIINHQTAPLELKLRPRPPSRHLIKIETVSPGKRLRLTLTVPAGTPAGRVSERLEFQTSSAVQPILYVGANSIVRERVHTFPETVDFGTLAMRELKSSKTAAAGTTQTLMIYQTGGSKFYVKARSNLPGIEVATETGAKGDRAQVTLSLLASRLKPGPIRGTLTLRTNDARFPELSVPITGEITQDK